MTKEETIAEAVEIAWITLWDTIYVASPQELEEIEQQVLRGLSQNFASLRANRGIDISQK